MCFFVCNLLVVWHALVPSFPSSLSSCYFFQFLWLPLRRGPRFDPLPLPARLVIFFPCFPSRIAVVAFFRPPFQASTSFSSIRLCLLLPLVGFAFDSVDWPTRVAVEFLGHPSFGPGSSLLLPSPSGAPLLPRALTSFFFSSEASRAQSLDSPFSAVCFFPSSSFPRFLVCLLWPDAPICVSAHSFRSVSRRFRFLPLIDLLLPFPFQQSTLHLSLVQIADSAIFSPTFAERNERTEGEEDFRAFLLALPLADRSAWLFFPFSAFCFSSILHPCFLSCWTWTLGRLWNDVKNTVDLFFLAKSTRKETMVTVSTHT